MAESYVIFPELEDKIKNSGLLEKYPDLEDYLWIYGESDNNEINGAFTQLSGKVKDQIGTFWNNAIRDSSKWELDGLVTIPRTGNDLMLATGGYLDGTGITNNVLLDYQKYGFRSMLEMIISLSAYRSSNEGYEGINQIHSWVENNIKTILGIGEHGEVKLFQFREKSKSVKSPFGEQVAFMPRVVSKINEIYNAESQLWLFGIILRFAYEKQILDQVLQDNHNPLGLLIEDKISELNGHIGDGISESEIITAGSFVNTPLNKGYHGLPCMNHEHITYNFQLIGDNLIIKTISAGEYDGGSFIIQPGDCKDILQGLIMSINATTRRPDILLELVKNAQNL